MARTGGPVSSPGHLGLSHPKKIHVAGQDREVGIGRCHQAIARVPIAEEHVRDQLQAGLPAHWLTKKEHPCKRKGMK